MRRITRNGFIAFLLLLLLLSLPFWLRDGLISEGNFIQEQYSSGGNSPTKEILPATTLSNPSSAAQASLKITLVDAGWVAGNNTEQGFVHPPAILRWDPAQNLVDWRLETDSIGGAFVDDQDRIYFLEQQSLIILDGHTGEVLSRFEAENMAMSGLIASQSIPIALQGNRLYFRN